MSDLSHLSSDTVHSIERYERNWHITKALLLTAGVIIIVAVQIATSNRLFENSNKNRQLLRCTVATLTNPDNTPKTFEASLQSCLEITK